MTTFINNLHFPDTVLLWPPFHIHSVLLV